MSRGPGRIVTVISDAFAGAADKCFTTDELVVLAFPGRNLIEKKHRVSVLRAAYSAMGPAWWSCRRVGKGQMVFYNLTSKASMVVAFGSHGRDAFFEEKASAYRAARDGDPAPLVAFEKMRASAFASLRPGIHTPRGWGWLTNPKRAAYNRVYSRTTISVWSLMRRLLK